MEKFNQASFLKIVLFQPEIAQNMGTIVRLCACFGVSMDVIEPCGFPFSSKALKRSAMDYADLVSVKTHINFLKYCENKIVKHNKSRVILMTTKGTQSLWDFSFNKHDHLFFGSEGSGVPPSVSENVDAKIFIPMQGGGRSLNLAVSAGIALAEATRQLI